MNYFVLFYSTSEDKTLQASVHILHLLDGSGKFWLQIKIKVFREYEDQDKKSRPVLPAFIIKIQNCISFLQPFRLHFSVDGIKMIALLLEIFRSERSIHLILERK